jgi:hypothetical protein
MSFRQFDVFVQNRPGEAARVTEAMAKKAVNIRGISTDLGASKPMVRIITDDDATARAGLTQSALEFTEKEVVVLSLADKPGELAKVIKKLAKAGINIESMFMLTSKGSMVEVAVGVDKLDEAKKALDYS